ncbi:MAG: sulfurtransferase complex subunit TusB [Cellvibrionaceae bacterium]|nr:sulfurtransferase complex subunit TusB [Cellvibrionaceae bacterium]
MSHAILHLVNQSPFDNHRLQECLQHCCANDAIVLFDEGVYGALASQTYAQQLSQQRVYAIDDDLQLRGLAQAPLIDTVQLINYDDFVRLTTDYPLTQSWY